MGRFINWLSIVAVSFIFLYTPYLRGLFFDSDLYATESIVAILFVVCGLWKLKDQRETNLFYLLVFLIPLVYLLSLTQAETPKGALDNLFRWLMYSTMFVIMVWAKESDESKKIEKSLPFVFQLTGIWLSFFSVFGLWGWIEFKDLMLGERLTGTFQYANTFAAVICAFWLFALVMLAKRDLPTWSAVFFSLPLVAYGVALFHSYSRGALLVFPVAWLLGLFLLRGKEQVSYLISSALSVAASFFVYRTITLQAESGSVNPGVFLFFALTGAIIVAHMFIKLLINRTGILGALANKRYAQFILPASVIVVGLLLALDIKYQGLVYQQLPTSLQQRISDISLETTSLLGRTNVYEDALRISMDSPIIGVGGEGWRILYPQYQKVPYFNNEVHNGYLDVLVSTGWLGLCVFLAVIGLLTAQIILRIKRGREDQGVSVAVATLPALAMILLHGAIDFDFSYGTVWFVAFFLFAMGVPVDQMLIGRSSGASIGMVGKRAILALCSVFVLVLGVYSFRFYLAESTTAQVQAQLSVEQAQSLLEKAASYNPYYIDYQLNLANAYAARYRNESKEEWKTKAIEKLHIAESLEPNNANGALGIANGYFELNDWEKGLEYLQKSTRQDPFNVHTIDSAIRAESQLAAQFAQMKAKDKAKSLAQQAIYHYMNYLRIVDTFKTQEIPDKRPLDLQNRTNLFVGQSYMILGQYSQAVQLLNSVSDPSYEEDAQALLVVAYESLGKKEQAATITKSLIPQLPNFAQKVVAFRSIVSRE